MNAVKDAALDESAKALVILLSEAVARMFPDDHDKRLKMCEVMYKQLLAHIKMRAVIVNELRPVMEKAEAEKRPVTIEELQENFEGLKQKLRAKMETVGGPRVIEERKH